MESILVLHPCHPAIYHFPPTTPTRPRAPSLVLRERQLSSRGSNLNSLRDPRAIPCRDTFHISLQCRDGKTYSWILDCHLKPNNHPIRRGTIYSHEK